MYHIGLDSHNCYPVKLEDALEEIKMLKYKTRNRESFYNGQMF